MIRTIAISQRRLLILLVHMLLAALAYTLSFMLRFDGIIPSDQLNIWLVTLPFAVGQKALAVHIFGLNRGLWRYVNSTDLIKIIKAVTLGSVVFIAGMTIAQVGLPRSIYFIDCLVTMILFGGIRFSYRLHNEFFRPSLESRTGEKMVIVGAGEAGEIALRLVEKDFAGKLNVIGFLDDDPAKHKLTIHGCPIIGKSCDIVNLIDAKEIKHVLIAIPSASKKFVRDIVESCQELHAHVHFQILPTVGDMINGQMQSSGVRDICVEDLLGRDPVKLDRQIVANEVTGKVVLVTGAGGSIGSELCRQIATYKPSALMMIEIAESALFEIDRELSVSFPGLKRIPCIADIKHIDIIDSIFTEHKPKLIYHAAAYKHVPLMEDHPVQAVMNNVVGTHNLAQTAINHNVEKFLMISTDKAVRPTNVMGATKRCAELLVSRYNNQGTKFVAVRFGNVLGSNGSVVPIFRKQIEMGGPVWVTHPDITRYFMTIPEAVELVLQAASNGNGGEVFVLEMDEPVKIVDLAKNMIELAGLVPGKDIMIEFSGLRPGEKMYEELVAYGENIDKTSIPKLQVMKPDKNINEALIEEFFAELAELEGFARKRKKNETIMKLWVLVNNNDPDVDMSKTSSFKALQANQVNNELRSSQK